MGTLSDSVAALALMTWLSIQSQVTEQAPTPPDTLVARADAALARGNWVDAIDALTAAERAQPLNPALVLKLGTAHARAGHELAALTWLHCYLAVAPDPAAQTAASRQIPPLLGQAEARIRRILQEASAGLRELGEIDRDTVMELQQLAVQSALVGGDLAGARQAALAADESSRDTLWVGAAGALAAEGDLIHAHHAAANVADASAREALRASLAGLESATATPPALPVRWEALAREISSRAEIVDLDRVLGDLTKVDGPMIPVRLMELGTGLRAWLGKIQRLAGEAASAGRTP